MVLAGALAIALTVLVPRPDIILTNPQFFPADCDAEAGTRSLIATFTLTNRGAISGAMEVDLDADGRVLSSGLLFEVPAHASIQGTISTVVPDCASHRYSLSLHYPPSSG